MARYLRTASGANTARIATVQHRQQERMLARERAGREGARVAEQLLVACVSTLIGFHSAIGWSTSGSVSVGTNAFERNVSEDDQEAELLDGLHRRREQAQQDTNPAIAYV